MKIVSNTDQTTDALKKRIKELENIIADNQKDNEDLFEILEKFDQITRNQKAIYSINDFNLQCKFTYISPSVKQITGFEPDELIGKSFFNYIHPEDKKTIILPLLKKYLQYKAQNLLTGKQKKPSISFKYRAKDKKGKWYHAETTINAIGNKLVSITTDIGEQIEFKKKLTETTVDYANLLNNLDDIYYKLNKEGILVDINPAVEKISGHSRNELIGQPVDTFFKDQDNRYNFINEIKKKGIVKNYELVFTHKNGTDIYVSANSYILKDAHGNPIGIEGILRNTTEQKKAQFILESTNKELSKYAEIVEGMNECVSITDKNHKLVFINSAFERTYGYSKDEIIGKASNILIAKESDELRKEIRHKTVKGGWKGELLNRKKDGTTFPIELSVAPLYDDEGNMYAQIGISTDISNRVQTEKNLKASEEKFRTAFLTSPDSININRMSDGMYVSISSGFTNIVGYTEKDAIGKTSVDLDIWQNPRDRKKLVKDLKKNGIVRDLEAKFIAKNGDIKDGLMSAAIMELNGEPHIISVTRDITERKKTEKELLQKTSDLTLINAVNVGINKGKNFKEITKLINIELKRVFDSNNSTLYLVSEDKKFLELQNMFLSETIIKNIEKLIGFKIPEIRIPIKEGSLTKQYLKAKAVQLITDPDIIKTRILEFTEISALSDRMRKTVQKLIEPIYKLIGIRSYIILPLVSGKEQIGILEISSSKLFKDNDKIRLTGVAGQLANAIKKLQIEQELRLSEEKFREMTNLLPQIIYEHDLSGNITYSNKLGFKLFKYSQEDFNKGINILEVLIPEDRDRAKRNNEKLLSGTQPGDHEFTALIKDGSTCPVLIYSNLILRNNKPVGVRGTVVDITERKKIEQALLESEKRYRKFFMEDISGDFLSTKDGKILDCNPAFLKMFGFKSLNEVKEYDSNKFYDGKQNRDKYIQLLEDKKTLTNNVLELTNVKGEKLIVRENVSGNFDKDGKLITIKGYILDITESVKAEQELQKLSTAVEQSPVSIIITDTDGVIEYVNPIFEKLTMYSAKEAIGLKPSILKSGVMPDSIYKDLWNTISQGKIWSNELLNKKKNGELYWESVTISPVKDKNNNITNYLAVKEDVTEQKNIVGELMDREEKFRTLTQNLNIGVYRNTPGNNGKFIEVNPAFLKMFGFRSRSELERYKVVDLYPNPDERKVIEEELQSKGFVLNNEIQLRRKDGTLFYASISATTAKNELGTVIHYDGIVEDITERHKMMEQIIQERDKSQLYLDIAGVMFLALDKKGNIILANQKTCEILGEKEDKLLGKNWFDNFLPKPIQSETKKVFIALINDQGPIGGFHDNEIVTANGEKRIISWRNTSLRDDSGKIIGVLSSGIDITERKAAEQLQTNLYETARYLTESLDIDEVLVRMSKRARVLLKCKGVTIYMLEEDKKTLRPVVSYDPPFTKKMLATKLSVDNSLTGRSVKAKTGMIFNSAEDIQGAYHIKGTPNNDNENLIVSPIKIDKDVIGAITFIREDISFNVNDLNVANTFAAYASTAIKNARSHNQLQFEIEERLQTEALLKESHDLYESIFSGATDGIVHADWEGTIQSVNPVFIRLTGLKKEDLIGKNGIRLVQKMLPKKVILDNINNFRKIAKGYAVQALPIKFNKKDLEIYTTVGKGKIGITLIVRDVTELNKSKDNIAKYQSNLKLLTNELLITEEQAKRRLALTLHDKLGQSLVLANFKASELNKQITNSEHKKMLDEITSFVEDAIKESRNITYELSPPVLYEMGLVSAISWNLDEMKKSNKIQTSLTDNSKEFELDKNVEIVIYRSINELLQNVKKHSKARNVNVSFQLLMDAYRITIKDDGIGFDFKSMRDQAVQDKKFGLFSIIERIKYIGGEVIIDTKPKMGTKVVINLPIKN